VSGSFDPELNTIFYGTGQPGSQWAGDVREGDNLFTECVVALDVDTGKMKWHFSSRRTTCATGMRWKCRC
jgi:alcohol dehydrogenase (cytochrome c)